MTAPQAPGRSEARRRPWRAIAMVAAFLLLLSAAAALWRGDAGAASDRSRGARLFDGREPLAATLAGHATPLPSDTARCIQCHAAPGPAHPPEASGKLQALGKFQGLQGLPGPTLDRRQLREAQPRRGGPPVAYTLASFCQTLRSGIDPAHVLLPRSMPRFDIDDARCAALWTYLTRENQ